MQSAAAVEFVDESSYKAVCYKCHYVGLGTLTKCPLCSFPIILETGHVDDSTQVEELFDRASVNVGAPPLPGIDGRPRKAQLLAEARKRAKIESILQEQQQHQRQRRHTTVSEIARMSKVRVTFAFVSALMAGLLAAVATGGI